MGEAGRLVVSQMQAVVTTDVGGHFGGGEGSLGFALLLPDAQQDSTSHMNHNTGAPNGRMGQKSQVQREKSG